MKTYYDASFQKAIKKLHKNQLADLKEAMKTIIADPTCGQKKTGDLSFMHVYKFSMAKQRVLLSYMVDGDAIHFLMLGPHENFYRDAKR